MFQRKKHSDEEDYRKIKIEEDPVTQEGEMAEASGKPGPSAEGEKVEEETVFPEGKEEPPEGGEALAGAAPSAEEKEPPEGGEALAVAAPSTEGKESSEVEEASKPVRSSPPKWLLWLKRIALGVLILGVSMAMTFGYSLWSEFSNDESIDGKEILVEIPKGSTTKNTAHILKEAGVIRYETAFMARVYFSEYRGKLRYGTFYLNDGLCLKELVRSLSVAGALKDEESFTVPEGYSIEMIAEKLEKENIISSEEFLTAVQNAAAESPYRDELPAKNTVFYQLQGYLFPDTYHVSDDMTGDQLVKKMLDNFDEQFGPDRQKKAQELGLSVEEVLIRASLVQKESDIADEYAIIAGVINNRLEKNMKLQFDSTTVYAMTNGLYGVSRVTYNDLKLESPYNTYYVKGLPPGPICNPGMEAIDGVLNAQKHGYLYFQTDKTKNDGSNLFFETYEEHSSASALDTSAATEEEKEDTAGKSSSSKTSGDTTTAK